MLKLLMLRKKLEKLQREVDPIAEDLKAISKRERELSDDIRAKEDLTDEEMEIIESEVETNEKEKQKLEEKKEELKKEIEKIEEEIKELEDKTEDVVDDEEKKEERKIINNKALRGGQGMLLEKREQLRMLVQREENKNFFENVAKLITRDATNLTGKELLIPKEVMSVINQEIIGYGELVKLVNKVTLNGQGRVVFNAGTPKLFWTEQCADLQEAVLGQIKEVELDGFKLGGYVFLCKAFVEDSIIDVADYIIKEFAKAIAIALDEAIINGKGASSKEPEGILTALASEEEKTVKNILGVLGTVGTLNSNTKNVTLVVNRATYYTRILPETFGKDSSGKIVYGLGQTLPDGTKVVISEAVKTDKFVLGDFKQYVLVERKGMTFDTSEQVRWIEEQIGYKTSGRYDGKVTDKSYFVKGAFSSLLEA